jgi:peroxiredoxin
MDRLVGRKLPDIWLRATDGRDINPSELSGCSVIFCYPYTGKPGFPDPPDWNRIPGAHGSTPQALSFSNAYNDYQKQSISVFGLSFQTVDWQIEFVARTNLRVPLLSDEKRRFAETLDLPKFRAGEHDFLKRLTIVARNGVIAKVRYPVSDPAEDAQAVLNFIAGQTRT